MVSRISFHFLPQPREFLLVFQGVNSGDTDLTVHSSVDAVTRTQHVMRKDYARMGVRTDGGGFAVWRVKIHCTNVCGLLLYVNFSF